MTGERPQFPFPPPPAGYRWQPCIFQFDSSNTPILGSLGGMLTGQQSPYIPLRLDRDSRFFLLAVRLSDTAGLSVELFTPWSDPLMDSPVAAKEYASNTVPVTALEFGVEVPAGAVFTVRYQAQ